MKGQNKIPEKEIKKINERNHKEIGKSIYLGKQAYDWGKGRTED